MAGLARLAFYFPRVFSSKEAGFTELPTPCWSHFTQRVSGCPLSVTALGVEVVAPGNAASGWRPTLGLDRALISPFLFGERLAGLGKVAFFLR